LVAQSESEKKVNFEPSSGGPTLVSSGSPGVWIALTLGVWASLELYKMMAYEKNFNQMPIMAIENPISESVAGQPWCFVQNWAYFSLA
jgi:hypothetical protein